MKHGYAMVRPDSPWVDGDFYLHINSEPVIIEAGSRQRALPCIICATPIGGARCYLVCLVAGLLCPTDNSHLGGLGTFCHIRCLPQSQKVLIKAVSRMLQGSGH